METLGWPKRTDMWKVRQTDEVKEIERQTDRHANRKTQTVTTIRQTNRYIGTQVVERHRPTILLYSPVGLRDPMIACMTGDGNDILERRSYWYLKMSPPPRHTFINN